MPVWYYLLLLCTISATVSATFKTKEISLRTNKQKPSLRFKRASEIDTKSHFDQQIDYLIGIIPEKLDNAVVVIEETQKITVFKRVTQGWSIVIASWFDIYSDFVINNRSLGNFGPVTKPWSYGFLGFYGVGFGFPLLLGLPEDTLACGSKDFNEAVEQFQLSDGLGPLINSGKSISDISSILSEFDTWVRVKIACVLDFGGSFPEAQDVAFALDDLNYALTVRLEIERAEREKDETNTITNERSDVKYLASKAFVDFRS